MRIKISPLLLRTLVLAVVAALVLAIPAPTQVSSAPIGNSVLARAVDIELGLVEPGEKEQLVSSGAVYAALLATGELERRAAAGKDPSKAFSRHGTQGCSNRFEGGGQGGSNVRVNQDCSLRRQAEEIVVVNPLDDDNLIAGQNDSRIGFNHCGYAWSFDGGKSWGDQTPPFWQFTLLDGHTADACSDPSATFDSKGNAYVTGVIFDVAATAFANAIVVAKSNAPIGGAFYHSPRVQPFQTYRDVPLGVVANDNDATIFNDKELMVADANAGSPKHDNVYVTWTRFSGGHSPIYFSQSTNGGDTWSAGIEIDGVNPSICTVPVAGPCNDNQGSHPIVGPDGTIYVIFGNSNTPGLGLNQVAFVKCPAANNCASPASWTAPVRINSLIGTHPRQVGPNPVTGCPSGRRCLPPNGYRVPEFTSMSISIDDGGKLYAVWSDFRNGGPPCTSPNNTATPPCDNDVFYSFSTNSGATWSSEVNVAPASKFGKTAQWQPWSKVTKDGTLFVAYYDRSYGSCETTGCNDITLAKITNAASSSRSFKYTRLTTDSMPNLVVANNPIQAGFLGDYMWVDLDSQGRPLVVWADTRGLDGTVEEDIYFARPLP
ncbi:MAG: hypothetical protein E6H88_00965 [Chloroflexi bacterium]|nr:MAG: hypothetical protein E6H88_00965 [Chloroflexota bacterium]